MKIEYDTSQYIKKLNSGDSYFKTFINKQSLASGVLLLKPNEEDTQEPHESDEIYYVINGNGFLQIKKNLIQLKRGISILLQKMCHITFMEIQKIF